MTDFPAYDDERGVLVPIELDDAAFAPRRIFAVTGPPEGATRGGHEVTCREQVVLVSGRAELPSTAAPWSSTGPVRPQFWSPGRRWTTTSRPAARPSSSSPSSPGRGRARDSRVGADPDP